MPGAFNRVILGTALLAALFHIITLTMSLADLIVVLNGLFLGSVCAVVIAYGGLLWNALVGKRPYDRVRQMTLGFFVLWAAYVVSTGNSIYLRSLGTELPGHYVTAAHRYLAIIAATLQVTAPDFGLGIFHGRDRKVLGASLFIGAGVALFTIYVQVESVLAAPI